MSSENIVKSCIISEIIENLFSRIESDIKQTENQNKKELSERDLIELDSLFPDTLEDALHILDTKTITIYKLDTPLNSKYRPIKLCEISGRSGETFKLYLDINYCDCLDFEFKVLNCSMYCCKHVLALKLAVILNKFKEEILTHEKFEFLFNQME